MCFTYTVWLITPNSGCLLDFAKKNACIHVHADSTRNKQTRTTALAPAHCACIGNYTVIKKMTFCSKTYFCFSGLSKWTFNGNDWQQQTYLYCDGCGLLWIKIFTIFKQNNMYSTGQWHFAKSFSYTWFFKLLQKVLDFFIYNYTIYHRIAAT